MEILNSGSERISFYFYNLYTTTVQNLHSNTFYYKNDPKDNNMEEHNLSDDFEKWSARLSLSNLLTFYFIKLTNIIHFLEFFRNSNNIGFYWEFFQKSGVINCSCGCNSKRSPFQDLCMFVQCTVSQIVAEISRPSLRPSPRRKK